MLNNDFIMLSDVILFNRQNINYTVLNSDENIVNLINTMNCPVEYNGKVIGCLAHPYIDNGIIRGDVYMQKEYKDDIVNIPYLEYEFLSNVSNVYSSEITITNIIVHCKTASNNEV